MKNKKKGTSYGKNMTCAVFSIVKNWRISLFLELGKNVKMFGVRGWDLFFRRYGGGSRYGVLAVSHTRLLIVQRGRCTYYGLLCFLVGTASSPYPIQGCYWCAAGTLHLLRVAVLFSRYGVLAVSHTRLLVCSGDAAPTTACCAF